MSNEDRTLNGGKVKTMALRLDSDQHAQLTLIAQLQGHTLIDEIRSAITAHIEAVGSTPELAAQAGTVLEAIEQEAAARREAIASLFGGSAPAEASTGSSKSRSRRTGSTEAAPAES